MVECIAQLVRSEPLNAQKSYSQSSSECDKFEQRAFRYTFAKDQKTKPIQSKWATSWNSFLFRQGYPGTNTKCHMDRLFELQKWPTTTQPLVVVIDIAVNALSALMRTVDWETAAQLLCEKKILRKSVWESRWCVTASPWFIIDFFCAGIRLCVEVNESLITDPSQIILDDCMSTESTPSTTLGDYKNMTTDANKTNLVLRDHTMADSAPAASLAINPELLSHVGDGIFLNSKTSQVLAGIAVWIALFITCQQVWQTVSRRDSTLTPIASRSNRFIIIWDGTRTHRSNDGSSESCSLCRFMRPTLGLAWSFSTPRAFTYTFLP